MDLKNNPKIRYCKIKKKSKKPIEKDWTNKPYKWEEIENVVPNENYGVLCGYGDLIVIDADTPELQLAVDSTLPETFKVKTGSGGTHNYFFCLDTTKRVLSTVEKGVETHYGEVQGKGSQVVGPGSIHPNGNRYEVVNDAEIANISPEQLLMAIKPFMKEVQQIEEDSYKESKDFGFPLDNLSVTSIWGLSGLKKRGNEYFGEHPVHGSDGGMNFWINPLKNTWHCFRCGSGGGPLSAIAVKEGIISCSEARRGVLRGAKARQAIQVAKEKYGLVEPEENPIEEKQKIEVSTKEDALPLWTFKDFENLKEDKNYLVEKVIYPKTVTMLYSPPGQFKSLLALSLAMSVAKGKEWMKFKTKKNNVLYCDKENNDQTLKSRLAMLYYGFDWKRKNFPMFILRRQGDLLDNRFMLKLRQVILDKKIKLIIFDTLHRFADYDENASDDINRLYTQVFQPLVETFGVSIIFLHHTRKDGGYRGSGDFLGMVDTSYAVYRTGKTPKFQIINEKARGGEIENVYGEIDFGEKFIRINRLNETVEKEKSLSKLKEMTEKVKEMFEPGEELRRKDIEARFDMDNYEFSLSTLKRSLAWLVKINWLDFDKGLYKVVMR